MPRPDRASRGQGERGWPEWRNARVVRASAIADNLRMIEFAVEGGLAAFGSDARTRVRSLDGGSDDTAGRSAVRAGTYLCVNVGEGRMRVLVPSRQGSAGARFMWLLTEGARVRLTVPAGPAADVAPAKLAGIASLRLHLGGGPGHIAGFHAGLAARAANTNAPSRLNISF